MRLINTATGLFEEFITRNVPKYAILSHTWEEEEVSFSDMQKDGHQAKKGFEKIRMTCKLAADAGIRYAWVDTCCIDKSSSAELTEAINSMYRWYQRSTICYAYLSDLSPSDSLDTALPSCRWFTRGWTLQELIAPTEMRFFNRSWIDRGSKESLCTKLSEITGIDPRVLRHELPLSSIAVAQRMSWAAKRDTTRIEDRSYSLLGLFGVHMPMIYGEEEKAFRRLQEEIIKSTLDMSIFAWKMPEHTKPLDYPGTQYVCGLLASSPDDFWDCGAMSPAEDSNSKNIEFSISNKGIKSRSRIDPCDEWREGIVLSLQCALSPGHYRTVAARMTRWGFDQFLRQDPWSLPWSPGHAIFDGDETSPQAQYFLSELPDNTGGDSEDRRYCQKAPFLAARRYGVLQIQFPVYTEAEFELVYGWHEHQWNRGDSVFFIQSRQRAGQGDLGFCGLKFSISSVDVNRYLNYTLLVDGWTSDFRAEHPEPYDEDAPMSRFFQFTIVDINDFNPLDSRLPGQTDLEFEKKL